MKTIYIIALGILIGLVTVAYSSEWILADDPPFNSKYEKNYTLNLKCTENQTLFDIPCYEKPLEIAWSIYSFDTSKIANTVTVYYKSWITVDGKEVGHHKGAINYDKVKENVHLKIAEETKERLVLEFNANNTIELKDKIYGSGKGIIK